MQKLDRWTLVPTIVLVIGVLLACKKKEEEQPPPVDTTPPPAATSAEPPKEEPKKDNVTRYGDKEQVESGTVRVTYMHAKVFKEADDTTSHIATLSTGTYVNRKARYGNYMLIDYPSGVGELSPGWILAKYLSSTALKIDINEVKNQDAGVVAVVDAGTPAVVVDAGTPAVVVDAGTPAVVVDAGKVRLPNLKKIKPAGAQ